MNRIRVWCCAAVLTLAVGGCQQSGAEPNAEPGAAPPSTAAATTTPARTPSVKPSPALADGRHPVFLTKIDTAGRAVSFDLIEFLTGEAAKKRWKKEHPENPEGPDNDYMIVNENPKVRTLPVAPDAECKVLPTLGSVDPETISFGELPAALKKQNKEASPEAPHISVLPFWLTVKNGSVVELEEQFLP